MEFNNVIPNAECYWTFKHSSQNSLMTFNGEYFQQFFGVIIGMSVAPILANIYLAKLEKLLLEKCKTDKKVL